MTRSSLLAGNYSSIPDTSLITKSFLSGRWLVIVVSKNWKKHHHRVPFIMSCDHPYKVAIIPHCIFSHPIWCSLTFQYPSVWSVPHWASIGKDMSINYKSCLDHTYSFHSIGLPILIVHHRETHLTDGVPGLKLMWKWDLFEQDFCQDIKRWAK